jgi:glycosyltransferase involved in cell wall biosynthesis
MKILVVCQYYYPDNRSSTPICEALQKTGHQVTVITGLPNYGYGKIVPGYEKKYFEVINGVRVFRVKLKPRTKKKISLIENYWSFWKNSKRFIKKFKEENDIVFSMCQSPLMACECADIYAKEHHIPHIHYCLDVWPESLVAAKATRKGSLLYRYFLKLSKQIYAPMDQIIVSSPSFEAYFRSTLNFGDKKIIFIPQPVDVPSSPKTPIVYKRHFNFVYAGNVGKVQNLQSVVQAFRRLSENTDCSLFVLGDGADLDNIKKMVNAFRLSDRVIFTGWITPNEASRYFPSATALIASLKDDGTVVSKTIPNKLITYFSYGKPVISCLSGDGADLSKQTRGCFVSSCSPDSIFESLKNCVASDPNKLKQMGINNKIYYDTYLSSQVIMGRINECLCAGGKKE